jgi:hypothetical protein
MNERIKELLVNAMTEIGPDDTDLKTLEKFAELIVRECASQLNDGAEDGMWARGVLYRHFGVEE